MRPFCRLGEVTLYAEDYTAERLRRRIPYCFAEHKYPGVPQVKLQEIYPGRPFFIREVEVMPLRVMHGPLPILGYRIGGLVYITDMKSMPEEEFAHLENVDCLVANALRFEPHWTHQNVEEALAFAARVGAKETYFTHASHHIGLHAVFSQSLPPHVHMAYDGLEIEV